MKSTFSKAGGLPYLCALFFVGSFIAQNIDQIVISPTNILDSFFIAGITLSFVVAVSLVFIPLIKAPTRRSLLVTFAVAFLLSYGQIQLALGPELGRVRYIVPLFLLSFSLLFFGTHKLKDLAPIYQVTRTFFLVLVTVTAGRIGYNAYIAKSTVDSALSGESANSQLPDIYYIVPDMFLSGHVLREFYNHDHSDFSDAMEKRGFFVAKDSTSNYPYTILSLSSSLNFEYINYLEKRIDPKKPDTTMLLRRIGDNKVSQLLKSIGYKYITFNSPSVYYAETSDLHISCQGMNPVVREFALTTFLTAFYYRLPIFADNMRKDVLCAFNRLKELPKMKGPKFVLAHILSPHPPIVFGANGEKIPVIDTLKLTPVVRNGGSERLVEGFRDQLIYISKQVKDTVDTIIKTSTHEPIIIVQGDHGSFYGKGFEQWFDNLTSTSYREAFGIFNAYYVPDSIREKLYPSITPVNSFRLILNTLLEDKLELVQDKNYFVKTEDAHTPVGLYEVTSNLKQK